MALEIWSLWVIISILGYTGQYNFICPRYARCRWHRRTTAATPRIADLSFSACNLTKYLKPGLTRPISNKEMPLEMWLMIVLISILGYTGQYNFICPCYARCRWRRRVTAATPRIADLSFSASNLTKYLKPGLIQLISNKEMSLEIWLMIVLISILGYTAQ